jgi:hypothetical protein
MLRRVELWDDDLVIPSALAARAAAFAFGDELIDLELRYDSDSLWLSQGGRDIAAARLLPRAEAALRQELQRLADAVKRARKARALPRASRARYDGPRCVGDQNRAIAFNSVSVDPSYVAYQRLSSPQQPHKQQRRGTRAAST